MDSTVLAEPDSALVGNPSATFEVDRDGVAYIPDLSRGQILAYDRGGRFRRAYGRIGGGPGEFSAIGAFGHVADTLLFHTDGGALRLNVFDKRDGRFVGGLRYGAYAASVATLADTIWLGVLDLGAGRAGAFVPLDRGLQNAGQVDSAVVEAGMFATPPEYSRYPFLNRYSGVAMAVGPAEVLYGFGGLDYLVRVAGRGGSADTVVVPRCGRRGVDRDALEKVFRRGPRTVKEYAQARSTAAEAISGLVRIWRRPVGDYLIWYQDASLEPEGRVLKGVGYLSLLSSDLRRACVDAKVEAPGIGRPRIGLAGDTIVVLDQRIVGDDSVRAETVLTRYTIDPARCRWIALAD